MYVQYAPGEVIALKSFGYFLNRTDKSKTYILVTAYYY